MIKLDEAKVHLKMLLQKHEDEEFLHLVGICDIVLQEYDDAIQDVREETIGIINFSLYHSLNYIEDIEELFLAADMESADKVKLVNDFLELLSKTGGLDCICSFITIDSMRINKEYRNRNFGSLAIKELLNYSMYLNVDYIILHPAPIEKLESNETRINKIKEISKFYEKAGFKYFQVGNDEPIMVYCESSYLIPDLFSSDKLEIDPIHDDETPIKVTVPDVPFFKEIDTIFNKVFKKGVKD
ncbi:MAG: hypothetical protein R3267_06245 [Paenisporosarcina sp.]|nr:hypothetical protein [Paenisporosarcina sp.]